MGFDAQMKRYFPLLLCALIAMAAYFQASGIGQLVAASIGGAGEADMSPPSGLPGSLRTSSSRKSGTAILSRNPFDSVTGPLDGRSQPVPEPSTEEPLVEGEPGESDPKCDFGRVTLITASDDPAWSFAAIQDKGGQSKLRRMGDDVSGHTVQAMSWDTVWLASGAKRCRMKLGDEGKTSAPTASKGGDDEPKPRRRGRRRGRQLSPEMSSKINKVSDTEFNIERSLVDEILQNQAELMRSARIVPEKQGDEVVGIRLFGIRNGTLLGELGIKNGDRLEAINGFAMTDPQKALEAYGRLRTADKLSVKINRKGSPVTLDFNIQ